MRTLACLASLCFVAVSVSACTADTGSDDDAETSSDALTALTAAGCKTPTIQTSAKKDSNGQAIYGSAHTTLSGCIVGARGETGEAVLTRLTTLLGDTSKLSSVENDDGDRVFSRFSAGSKKGALATSLTQDLDVTLAMTGSPQTKLRAVQKRAAGKPYTLSIANTTEVNAKFAFFTIKVVDPGNLSLSIEVKPQQNGITVTGVSDIVLLQQQDKAAQSSTLVTNVFKWLTSELADTAPAPK